MTFYLNMKKYKVKAFIHSVRLILTLAHIYDLVLSDCSYQKRPFSPCEKDTRRVPQSLVCLIRILCSVTVHTVFFFLFNFPCEFCHRSAR